MASSQVAASPAASSRRDLLEAGKRRLEEFRKQKAAERAKKAAASSTENSQSSRLENRQSEQLSAGSVITQELNGIPFEQNPSKDTASSNLQPLLTTTSSLSLPVVPSNERGVPKIFIDDNFKVKSSAADLFRKETTASSNDSDSLHNNRPLAQLHKDNEKSDKEDVVLSNELDSGYMNSWRRSSLENNSELSKKQAKTVSNELNKDYVESTDSFSGKAEHVVASTKDEFVLSQEETYRDIHLDEWKGRAHEFLQKSSVEAHVPSSFFSKDLREKYQYNDPMDRHTDSIHISSSLLEPESSGKKYNNEPMAFGNGKLGEEEAKVSAEGSKFLFSDRSSSRQANGQDFSGEQSYSDTKSQPSTTLFSAVNSRRTRPSFLDSITSSAPSSTLQTLMAGSETSKLTGESVHTTESKTADMPAKRPWQSLSDGQEGPKKVGLHDSVLSQLEYSSSQKNDDFAALEQHIEDLTQEKFALQRALDASRTLAESLAQENSSLTEAFNQQGSVVSQLKADLERQQEEIKAQLLVLNTLKMESDNAQLECSAADERAKMLASEVISLEEKALRLRSNELKLERQLETLNDEIASNRKHISSLERERSDLRSTIDALQEEKKLLLSKLRKAAANDNFDGHAATKPSKEKKDMSTSTEDIGIELFNFPAGNGLFVARQEDATTVIPTSQALASTGNAPHVLDAQSAGTVSSTQFSSLSYPTFTSSLNSNQRHSSMDIPVAIPRDQQRMVDNINSLIEELALEKKSLAETLKAESAEVTKLRASNQELSQKLEAQTQRLELVIAQNMAHDSNAVGPRPIDSMHDEIEYVDEGDEVVERVLGWIMKLFPGGSSKRRTSKLL